LDLPPRPHIIYKIYKNKGIIYNLSPIEIYYFQKKARLEVKKVKKSQKPA